LGFIYISFNFKLGIILLSLNIKYQKFKTNSIAHHVCTDMEFLGGAWGQVNRMVQPFSTQKIDIQHFSPNENAYTFF
jgi:hypothetical protein